MINKTNWRPDTCKCSLNYLSDSEQPNVHQVAEIVTTCEVHAHINNGDDLFTTILTENRGKNGTIKQIMENVPSLLEEVIDSEGEVSKQFIPGKTPRWSFDENRNLIIETTDKMTELEKQSIASLIETVEILTEVK